MAMDEDARKLAELKAQQKARAARESELRTLIDSSTSLEDKVAAFKIVARADHVRFSTAFSKMMSDGKERKVPDDVG